MSSKRPSMFHCLKDARRAARARVFEKDGWNLLNKAARIASIEILAYLYYERPSTLYARYTELIRERILKGCERDDFREAIEFLIHISKISMHGINGKCFIMEPGITREEREFNKEILKTEKYSKLSRILNSVI